MLKNRSLLILVIILLVAVLTVLSCGRKGSLNPNVPPYVEISDYSGIAKTDTTWSDSTMFEEIGDLINPDIYDSLFYQEIFWRAWDVDGVVKSFAYRIGTWDSTKTNDDGTHWFYDRSYGVDVDSTEGWVLHLQSDSTYAIWTPLDERFPKTAVYFTATDTSDYKKNFGKFEVKCKDNYGEECIKSAIRYFVSWSDVPNTSVSTSQGNIDSCRVGTCIDFEFNQVGDNDPNDLGNEAAYYLYRIAFVQRVGAREDTLGKGFPDYRFSVGGEILGFQDNDSTWKSTKFEDEPNKIKLVFESNNINELTQIQVKTVDKAGIVDPSYCTMTFFVRDYFTPETCPFMSSIDERTKNIIAFKDNRLNLLPHVYVLGRNHYLTYLAQTEEVPSKYESGELHYGNQFYMDKAGNYTALWSDDIEIYLKWRYLGQYEYIQDETGGSVKLQGSTYAYDANLLDISEMKGFFQYYCNIEYMDIQFDGGVDGLPPLGTRITDEETGEEWRRIPIYEEQRCNLFNLTPGRHTFKVRAVDNQGAVDKTPEILEFDLIQMNQEKSGILIVYDTSYHNTFAPKGSIVYVYNEIVANIDTSIVRVDTIDVRDDYLQNTIRARNTELGHALEPCLAPSDIIDYKLIIWHNSNMLASQMYTSTQNNFYRFVNMLNIYINTSGNLFFNGTAEIKDHVGNNYQSDFLTDYAGLSIDNDVMNKFVIYPPLANLTLTGAYPREVYAGTLDTLYYNGNIISHPAFHDAYAGYTLFDIGYGIPLYNSLILETHPNHQNFEGVISVQYTKEPGVSGSCFILGVPLSYLELSGVKKFVNYIYDSVGIIHE